MPSMPSMPDMDSKEDSKKAYPRLYIDGGDELADLPEYGQMTVTFDRESLIKTDRDGKKTVSVCLEIKSIDKTRATVVEKEDASKALDKYAQEESEE